MRRGRLVSIWLRATLGLELLAAPALAGHYKWTTSGPEPGLVYQILVNPSDGSRLLVSAGIYGRLLFESTDGGQSWTQSENLLYSSRLIQDPADAQVLYTIGYTGDASGILKSPDGGSSWFPAGTGLPAGFTPYLLAAAPSAPGTLYLVGGNPGQAFRSVDGSASWQPLSGTVPTYSEGDMVVDPGDASVLYLTSGTGILKSSDGGASFAPLASAPAASRLVFDGRPPAILYAADSSGGIEKTTDGGATWQPANNGVAGQSIFDIALDPSDTQKLYAASLGHYPAPGGLYVSSNRGQSWSPVALDAPVNVATAVTLDPSDPSRVYAAASLIPQRGDFHSSADGGATWTTSDAGLSGYISHDVACDAALAGSGYAVSNATFYRTDDAGGTWTRKGSPPYSVVSFVVDPTNSQNLYAGTLTLGVGGFIRSGDGGVTWDNASSGLTLSNVYQVAIAPSAPDRLLLSAFEGLYATLDRGDSWSPVLTGQMRSAAFDPDDPSILYAGLWITYPDAGDALLRSADGGSTWNPPAGLPTGYPHVLDILVPKNDSSRVYAAFGEGIYRSVDRGLTFAPANSGLPAGFWPQRVAGDPTNPAMLLMAGQPSSPAPFVFLTRDGADSWIPVPSVLPSLSVFDVGVATGGRTFYAPTLSGVFMFERSFVDVPDADPFWASVDAAAMNGVTSGCGSGRFCPTAAVSRASVAVFLLRGRNGGLYQPPPATGDVFADVPIGSAAADFIEELAREGVTAGCGGGDYCPGASLTRAQTAVLFLKMEHGADYAPPPATGTIFADVPADAFAAAWIEQLFAEGITAGCGAGNFCPGAPVSRAQAAAFIVRTFGLS